MLLRVEAARSLLEHSAVAVLVAVLIVAVAGARRFVAAKPRRRGRRLIVGARARRLLVVYAAALAAAILAAKEVVLDGKIFNLDELRTCDSVRRRCCSCYEPFVQAAGRNKRRAS